MKLVIALLALLSAALPAVAGNVYDNGPVNGQVDAWTINFGFSVADSFTVSNGNGQVAGLDFGAWLFPGDTITSVEVQIGLEPFGHELFDGIVSLSQSNCFLNTFGYNVCTESSTFPTVNLANGDYWLTLLNAVVPSGNPVYWDENDGVGCQSPGCPSRATESTTGSIPSEAFTLTAATTTETTGATPEPGSLLLFASGFLGIAACLRRKVS